MKGRNYLFLKRNLRGVHEGKELSVSYTTPVVCERGVHEG
jgi:hypothetical protein